MADVSTLTFHMASVIIVLDAKGTFAPLGKIIASL
jgi:hypothetical protein